MEIKDVQINNKGVIVVAGDNLYKLSFKDYPLFLNSYVHQIYNVAHHGNTLYWRDLDFSVDVCNLPDITIKTFIR